MKLIQIFALAAALAVAALAQNTTSGTQNAGSTAQPKTTDKQKKSSPGIAATKTADKPMVQVTTSKSKTSTAKTGTKTAPTVEVKPATATHATGKTGSTKPGSSPPVVAVTPAAKQSTAAAKATTSAPAKSTSAQKTPAVAVTPASKTSASKDASKKQAGPFTAKSSAAPKAKPVTATPKTSASATKTTKKTTVAEKKIHPKVEQKKSAQSQPKVGTAAKGVTAAGRRDPFVSPIRNVSSLPQGPNCSTGKKCLYIPELVVQGTVKDNSTGEMMAVVINRDRRTYFLREKDQVFNGAVEKITGDSVVFREYATDNLGRESAHEVVKRVGPTS